jgi:hypothetical protein
MPEYCLKITRNDGADLVFGGLCKQELVQMLDQVRNAIVDGDQLNHMVPAQEVEI